MFHQNASIIDVLLGYGSRGGALYAAYRHPDNPLLLTDVRWQGPSGEQIEAHRNPDDMTMVREEREAWAHVALRSTTLRPDAVGPNAPWLQAPLDMREAYDFAIRAQRAREDANMPATQIMFHDIPSSAPAHPSSYSPGLPPGLAPISAPPPPRAFDGVAPFSNGPSRPAPYAQSASHGFGIPNGPDYPAGARGQRQSQYIDALPNFESASSVSDPTPSVSGSSQITGGWPRAAFMSPASQPSNEIIVIACVEIELPSLMTDAPQDFTRDFARDVAINFNRAARTIPQTRETRGWMHNGRMTLGALMALGTGSRPATRGEMELTADTLASALANRTLPYARMRFADMVEWAQGIPLPE